MSKQRVTAVFDIGRTNKKFFLFDEDYREVRREYVVLEETVDEEGYPTEDLAAVRQWLREVFHRILEARVYDVRAINFSSYGASFVHLDADGEVATPLYNYTKPVDDALLEEFYAKYGPEAEFTARTGSPRAGLLNSGMQLYWLKYRKPEVFGRIRYSLHLPQYLSYVFTGPPHQRIHQHRLPHRAVGLHHPGLSPLGLRREPAAHPAPHCLHRDEHQHEL